MRKPYPTDLSDVQWNYIEPHLPAPKGHERPRTHSLREILNAVFYVSEAVASGTCFSTTSLEIAYRLRLLQSLAHRRYLGAYQLGYPRTSADSHEARSTAQRRRG